MKIAPAIAAMAAFMGLSTNAHADSFASAILDIINAQLLHANGIAYSAGDFTARAGTNDGTALATLNGVTASATVSIPVQSPLRPDVPHQCVAACARAENDYVPFPNPPPVPGTFAYGDHLMVGDFITGGARIASRSDSSISGSGNALANAGASTTFVFGLVASDSMTISFDARPYTQAFVATGSAPGTTATASLSWRMDLVQLPGGATVFSYMPAQLNGLSNVSRTGAVPGTTTYDPGFAPFSATSPVLTPVVYDPGTLAMSVTMPMLQAGVLYQLTIRQGTLAGTLQVPEPASLALLAIGLLGMAGAMRRRA